MTELFVLLIYLFCLLLVTALAAGIAELIADALDWTSARDTKPGASSL